MEPAVPVIIAGLPLKCPHCGNDRFYERSYVLDSTTFQFLDFFNPSASNYLCAQCGRIEWFLLPPRPHEDNTSDPCECLECGKTIPAGQSSCPACGWSYR